MRILKAEKLWKRLPLLVVPPVMVKLSPALTTVPRSLPVTADMPGTVTQDNENANTQLRRDHRQNDFWYDIKAISQLHTHTTHSVQQCYRCYKPLYNDHVLLQHYCCYSIGLWCAYYSVSMKGQIEEYAYKGISYLDARSSYYQGKTVCYNAFLNNTKHVKTSFFQHI